MHLGDYSSGLGEGLDVAALRALPWKTVFTPSGGIVADDSEWTRTAAGYVRDPNVNMVGALSPAKDLLRANGYTGQIIGDGLIEVISGEGADITRVRAAPHPDLLAWLKAKGYTLKKANPQTGQKTGADYASLWQGDKLIGVNSVNWSNKPGTMGYLTLGLLAAIAGGAALTGAGVIGSGAGAASGTGAAGAAVPAAAAAAPAGGAVAATGGTAATIGTTVLKAAPAVIGALSKVAQTKAETKAAQEQSKAVQEQAAAIDALTKPAGSTPPQQSILAPGLLPGYASSLAPSYVDSDGRTQTAAVAPSKSLPSWAIPAAIGAAALLALPLLLNRRRTR